jgi:hypothetical protein
VDGGAELRGGRARLLASWRWGRPGAPPPRRAAHAPPASAAVALRLNAHWTLSFAGPDACELAFACAGVARRVALPLRPSTSTSTATASVPRPSLSERTDALSQEVKARQQALHPSSDRIQHAALRSLVAGLDAGLEPWLARGSGAWAEALLRESTLRGGSLRSALGSTAGSAASAAAARTTGAVPWVESGWRERALAATMAEAPGALWTEEKGQNASVAPGASHPVPAVAARLRLHGADLRRHLWHESPPLPRSRMLREASGRYVDPWGEGAPTRAADAADGGIGVGGGPVLEKLAWVRTAELDEFLRHKCDPAGVVLAVCVRTAEPACLRALQTLEHVKGSLHVAERLEASGAPPPVDDASVAAARALVRDVGGSAARLQLVAVDMAESTALTKRMHVTTLPYFMLFYGSGGFESAAVYAGVMGGVGVTTLPICDRAANVLLVEPHAPHQVTTEALLRRCGTPWSLAAGRFDAGAGRTLGAGVEAARLVQALAAAGAPSKRRADEAAERAAARDVGGGAGTDATGQLPSDFAVALVNAEDVSHEDAGALCRALAAAAPRSTPCPPPALVGATLVVAVHPSGTARFGRHSWRREPWVPVEPGGLAMAVDDSEESRAPPEPWACPRSGIIQNAQPHHLLHGAASVAVVRPIKRPTLEALARIWRRQRGGASALRSNVHLGMTHDDVVARMHAALRAGRAGRFLGPHWNERQGVPVSSSETVVRGTALVS